MVRQHLALGRTARNERDGRERVAPAGACAATVRNERDGRGRVATGDLRVLPLRGILFTFDGMVKTYA